MYPEHILRMLRRRRGLNEDDKSRDDVLNSMSMDRAFDEVCNWNGLINYGGTIRVWIRDIYGHYPPY